MLDGLTTKAGNSWLGYERSKAVTYTMKALYRSNKCFHNRHKVLESTLLVKATSNYLLAIKPRINRHDEGLDILDTNFQHFLTKDKAELLCNDFDTPQPSFGS